MGSDGDSENVEIVLSLEQVRYLANNNHLTDAQYSDWVKRLMLTKLGRCPESFDDHQCQNYAGHIGYHTHQNLGVYISWEQPKPKAHGEPNV